jgi:hypothetical protein
MKIGAAEAEPATSVKAVVVAMRVFVFISETCKAFQSLIGN